MGLKPCLGPWCKKPPFPILFYQPRAPSEAAVIASFFARVYTGWDLTSRVANSVEKKSGRWNKKSVKINFFFSFKVIFFYTASSLQSLLIGYDKFIKFFTGVFKICTHQYFRFYMSFLQPLSPSTRPKSAPVSNTALICGEEPPNIPSLA